MIQDLDSKSILWIHWRSMIQRGWIKIHIFLDMGRAFNCAEQGLKVMAFFLLSLSLTIRTNTQNWSICATSSKKSRKKTYTIIYFQFCLAICLSKSGRVRSKSYQFLYFVLALPSLKIDLLLSEIIVPRLPIYLLRKWEF